MLKEIIEYNYSIINFIITFEGDKGKKENKKDK